MTKTIYRTSATVTGGRAGRAVVEDGRLDLALSIPRELGGPGGPGTNPEQLFAAGYAACFETALRVAGAERGIRIADSSVTATVGLDHVDGGFRLVASLAVSLPGIDPAAAEDLMRFVHTSVCPYSKAVRGNVDVELRLAADGATHG